MALKSCARGRQADFAESDDKMPIFDTHAHYDSGAFNADRDGVLAALPAAGVTLVVNPGCDLESSRQAVALAERFPHVYAAVGIHPSDCGGAARRSLRN